MKEGWENIFFFGFIGSLVLTGVAYVFKPDTSYVDSPPLRDASPYYVCRVAASQILSAFALKMTQLANDMLGYKHGL